MITIHFNDAEEDLLNFFASIKPYQHMNDSEWKKVFSVNELLEKKIQEQKPLSDKKEAAF